MNFKVANDQRYYPNEKIHLLSNFNFDNNVIMSINHIQSLTINNSISLHNTKIDNEFDLAGVNFNNKENINFSDSKIYNENNSRHTFRIIKDALERSNDKIHANVYHSHEMKRRKKDLSLEDTFNPDNVLFFVNRHVSEYGLKWLIPLFWMIVIGFFYSGKLLNNGSDYLTISDVLIPLSILSYTLSFYKNIIKWEYLPRYYIPLLFSFAYYNNINEYNFDAFFRFINVIDFNIDIDKNFQISYTAKTVSKLIMVYLIYHFVVSSRKDTRR